MKYNCHGHSNSLVPLYARGAGSQRFSQLRCGKDDRAAAFWKFSGRYVDNTDALSRDAGRGDGGVIGGWQMSRTPTDLT